MAWPLKQGRAVAALLAVGLVACGPSPAAPSSPDAGTPPPDVGSAGVVSVPLKVASAWGGPVLLVPVSVNGSPPVEVLLDTGSSGLRLFASALGSTAVSTRGPSLDAIFGSDQLSGPEATGVVAIGDAGTPGPIAFQLVDAVGCPPGDAGCDPATENESVFTANGIHGILGVGLRPGSPADVYSPLAQLDPRLRGAFTIHTGGFGAPSGTLRLGAEGDGGFQEVALSGAGPLPDGVPAWSDDQVQVCFHVDGSADVPPCTPAIFDTGSNAVVVYAPNLPASAVSSDGTLAPGVDFEASWGPSLDVHFTVADPPTSGLDLVFVDTADDFSILGVGTFLRYDVRFDLTHGRIGFRAR